MTTAADESQELLASVLPQFFPAHWLSDTPDLLSKPFPSQIRLGYVSREDGGYSFVMQSLIRACGIDLADLHRAALRNLRILPMPNLIVGKTPGGSEAFLDDAEDNFGAARILLPEVQREIASKLGSKYLVAIPCRDRFMCWSTAQAVEWQERNFADAITDFRDDEYNLSPDVFLLSDGEFTLFRAQSHDA